MHKDIAEIIVSIELSDKDAHWKANKKAILIGYDSIIQNEVENLKTIKALLVQAILAITKEL